MWGQLLVRLRAIRDKMRTNFWEGYKELVAFQVLVVEFVDGFSSPQLGAAGMEEPPTDDEEREFDAIAQDITAFCNAEMTARSSGGIRPMAGADPRTGIDPATIMLIIKGVVELWDLFRRRRQQPPPTPPAAAPAGVDTNTPE